MTGIANTWEVQPGIMLKQVADIEFPQIFRDYHTADVYNPSLQKDRRLVLELLLPQYTFAHFHTTITVQAKAHANNGTLLFEKQYTEEGLGQGGKMFGLGAFGMKSAVRQSSLDAYRKIFSRLCSVYGIP